MLNLAESTMTTVNIIYISFSLNKILKRYQFTPQYLLPGPRKEQEIIKEVQVDGAGGELPLQAQVVLQCCQLTTLHQPPGLRDEWENLEGE